MCNSCFQTVYVVIYSSTIIILCLTVCLIVHHSLCYMWTFGLFKGTCMCANVYFIRVHGTRLYTKDVKYIHNLRRRRFAYFTICSIHSYTIIIWIHRFRTHNKIKSYSNTFVLKMYAGGKKNSHNVIVE